MPERPLLLSSAKTAVLVSESVPPWWQWTVLIVGVVVVFVGAANLLLTASHYVESRLPTFDARASLAPLGTLELPRITATTSAVEAFIPISLHMYSIGIDAKVEAVALGPDNKTMATPKIFGNVAWYSPGSKPGGSGNAVFAGHLNSPILGERGAFYNLSKATVGDVVVVMDAKNKEHLYSITSTKEYVTAAAPTAEIFTQNGPSQIVLITCEGSWDPKTKTFDKRLVVVARPLAL